MFASGVAFLAASLTVVEQPAQAAGAVDINILGINDFHGRIRADGLAAGGATLAGAVHQIRTEHPNTVFAAAGDLIGGSTFESFIARDKPTIDVLNSAGLEVSSVGNHEFDQGYRDLVDRVMAPESASNPDGGAEWKYLGANVQLRASGDPALDPTWVKEMDGVQVGFIGAVTESLLSVVRPSGVALVKVTDIPTAVNAEADRLKAEGVDVIVLLVHEGAPSTDCATMDDDPTSPFGSIISGVDDNVDAIISGHTHLAYNCSFPVAGWSGRPVTSRPVVSAGRYGYNLNQLDLSVDPATGQIQSIDQSLLNLTAKNGDGSPVYPADPATQAIVDQAVAQAAVRGSQPLGKIAGPFLRASRPTADGTGVEESRAAESSLANLVAEAQRWATRRPATGRAQIAFTNPGGVRDDLLGSTPGSYPNTVTYQQAATVQPFANTLINMDMTGAQLETALEQQWQPVGAARPFLRLGTSYGFDYTYDPATHEVTSMWLNGDLVRPDWTYSVTMNSYLATGGDNFSVFSSITNQRDTGVDDLSDLIDYVGVYTTDQPLQPNFSQRSVGVTFPLGAPTTYDAGDTLAFDLSSLTMSAPGNPVDDEVMVSIGDRDLGTFPVDNTVADGATDDEAGTASVSVVLPQGLPGGDQVVTVTGVETGTSAAIPVRLAKATSMIRASSRPHHVVVGKTKPTVWIVVRSGGQPAFGAVDVVVGETEIRASLNHGKVGVRLSAFKRAGEKQVLITYRGNAASHRATASITITVSQQ